MEEKVKQLSGNDKPQESQRAIKQIQKGKITPKSQLPKNQNKYWYAKSTQELKEKNSSVGFQKEKRNHQNDSGASWLISSEEKKVKKNKDCEFSADPARHQEIRNLFIDFVQCVNYHFSKCGTENAGSAISGRSKQINAIEEQNSHQSLGKRYQGEFAKQKGQVFANYQVIMEYQFVQDNQNDYKIILQNTRIENDDSSVSFGEEDFDLNHT